jgi:thymidylate synthase
MVTVIECETIGEAWQRAFDLIMQNGKSIRDDNEELIELLHLFLIVNSPEKELLVIQNHNETMKKWMRENFTQIIRVPELNNSWSYGWRLFNFQGKNQIDWIIKKLKKKPESKSATISMLQRAGEESYIPCVSLLDFKIRNNQLWLTATCRSLDFGQKAIHNMTNLARLSEKVADKLGISQNRLFMQINSAHIYKKDLK